MKKLLQCFAHLIPFLLLGVLWMYFPVSFSPDPVILLFFAVCLALCPPLGLICTSPFSRGLLGALSILCFSVGIPASLYLGGTIASYVVLCIGAVCLGTLIVAFLLSAFSDGTNLLRLRGVRINQARKILLFRSSYALFFKNSGILASIIVTWLLLISGDASPTTLWNSAGMVATISFFGYLLFLLLGAPASAHRTAPPKKSRFVFISLLCFVLLIITVYIYIGSVYTAPDPTLRSALVAVRSILTPALLASIAGLVAGLLLGFLLSFLGARFFMAVCRGILQFPVVLSVTFLSLLLPFSSIGIAAVVALWIASAVLEGRLAIRPYRHSPIAKRGKAIYLPLFIQPLLALLPRIGMFAIFSSVFLDITSSDTLLFLDEPKVLLAASILVVMLVALQILCLITKEVRRHE